jgi:hypothetical protein
MIVLYSDLAWLSKGCIVFSIGALCEYLSFWESTVLFHSWDTTFFGLLGDIKVTLSIRGLSWAHRGLGDDIFIIRAGDKARAELLLLSRSHADVVGVLVVEERKKSLVGIEKKWIILTRVQRGDGNGRETEPNSIVVK